MYRKLIREILDQNGWTANPGEVEAWMRLQYSTLDHLSRTTFELEVEIAVVSIQKAGPARSRELARSFGLAR